MTRYDGKIRNERVLQGLIDHRNNFKKLNNVTRFDNAYIASVK